ncbi:FadR/GntR family transcriptional regulator [Brevundimonas goettingensis]|uniref:FadR family transcriptional regulator n=1 Tax=Brevundimonas goettingensis TaxID=2774190 RepID=A0A975C3U8_9CAUL|nr:FadR/GntR family transcriptional regulator [Brevundimonas goettingensis]QTC92975.1 FadR family transcriptional regulator [Brevundimonas goettingensis]
MTTSTADTRKLYQQVATSVAAGIAAGQYLVGTRLPSERDLAEEFGVSRPTVREAMIALEIRGLVEARPGSGIYVTEAGPANGGPAPELDIGAFELTEARRLFEGEACALAAGVITDAELAELEVILKDMVGENTLTTAIGEHADRRFHATIARATRNAAIVMVVENLWDLRYRSPLCAAMLGRARQVGVRPLIEDHREILDALIARDPAAARGAMRAHLGRVIDGLLTATELDALERTRSDVEARRQDIARRTAI